MTTILYVEDNFQNFRLVNRMLQLEKRGYDVHQAEDGETALKMAPELAPDLILMDINLPDITGIEVTKRLKENPAMQEVPIVALTANAMVGDRERFLAAGCDGYLRKPISRDELREALKTFLPAAQTKASIPAEETDSKKKTTTDESKSKVAAAKAKNENKKSKAKVESKVVKRSKGQQEQ